MLAQVRTEHSQTKKEQMGSDSIPMPHLQGEGWPDSHPQLPGMDLIGQPQEYAPSSQLLK